MKNCCLASVGVLSSREVNARVERQRLCRRQSPVISTKLMFHCFFFLELKLRHRVWIQLYDMRVTVPGIFFRSVKMSKHEIGMRVT